MKSQIPKHLIIRTFAVAFLLLSTQLGHCYYNASTGRWLSRDPIGERSGANAYGFIANDPVNDVDVLGLLAASVVSIDVSEGSHLTAEYNGTYRQYIEANIKNLPPQTSASKPAASITATLDDSFSLDIRAWTMLSRDKSLTSLNLSTDISGTITVSCPCPFQRVRANWSVSAALSGTTGKAAATFEGYDAVTAWNKPSVTRSSPPVIKSLDSSYHAKFGFVAGQGWVDVSKTAPTTSHVSVRANFECIE